MRNRVVSRLVAGLLFMLLSGCEMPIPTGAPSPSSVDLPAGQNRAVGSPDDLRESFSPGAIQATVINAREFPVPGKDRTAASIVVGPDNNLWFTELRHIGTMSGAGQLLHYKQLKSTQSIPGALINRQDGYIWANTSERLPPRCRCPKCAPKCSLPLPQNRMDKIGRRISSSKFRRPCTSTRSPCLQTPSCFQPISRG